MRIACVQSNVHFADVPANQQSVLNWINQAGDQGAELVVLTECMLSGYGYESRREAMPHTIAMDDPIFSEFAHAAATHDLHFTVGFLERDGKRLFNASALIGPDGVVGHYRKIHLPHLGIDRFVDRGDMPYVAHAAQIGGQEIRIGLAICYDCSFPEPMRLLGLAGADIIALGTNWPVAAARTADVVPPARSMENQLFFVAANRVGTENGFSFCGKSSVCGLDGVVLAKADHDHEEMLIVEFDPLEARNKRIERTVGAHVIDRFADRRPEFYGDLAKSRADLEA